MSHVRCVPGHGYLKHQALSENPVGARDDQRSFYFNYTSDVLLFVFDLYYDTSGRMMFETCVYKDTFMYCTSYSQTILHVKSQETPSLQFL